MIYSRFFFFLFFLFFFTDTATTEIYTLSLHDALPVSDGEASSAPSRVVVSAANNAPSVSASALSTPDLQPLSLHATASDADSDPVALQWAMKDAGGKGYSLVQGTDGTPVFTPSSKGTYVLTVTPNDGTESGAPVDVTVTSANVAPVAVATASATNVTAGDTFTVSGAQ